MKMNEVEDYVRKNYKKLYGDKKLIINEFGTHYEVKSGIDESPLILSKTITG
jgi:hypothetical protein|tara:strand:- start:390 stop:545 length:156 start_codon:yes stop_codon:yes gene_type:complete